MNDKAGLIGKILFFSTLISILIKYGGRIVYLPPTNNIALLIVLLPSLVLSLTLIWRLQKQQRQESS
ncbi:MAG: hypothetical protein ACFCU5_03110 [Pleurocapsa sp.]